MSEALHQGPLGSTPVPDPTLLTTAALTREIAALKELMATRINALEEAQRVFRDDFVRVPTAVDRQIGQLKELHEKWFAEKFDSIVTQIQDMQALRDEKFDSVAQQFKERDTRSERESRDNKVAVDAAFAAQKEAAAKQDEANQKAIDKSERSTAETLNKSADLFKSTTDALAAQLFEAKDRITRIESLAIGRVTEAAVHTTAARDNSNLIFAVLGGLVGVAGIAIAVLK